MASEVAAKVKEKVLPFHAVHAAFYYGDQASSVLMPLKGAATKTISKGAIGGGAYNEAFKGRIKALGRDPTVDDVLRIRDDLVKQFGLEGYRP